MKGNRAAQPSKWHRQRIAVEALEAQLARQCSLHVEAKLERCLSLEREKVLCDMLVHAEFLQQLMGTFARQQDQAAQHAGSKGAAAGAPAHQDVVVGHAAGEQEQGLSPQHTQQAAESSPMVGQEGSPSPQQQQGEEPQEQEQVVVPQSYVASLLRQATPEQVQKVVRMTAQDWADFYKHQFSGLLMHLEMWSRAETAGSGGSGSSSGSGGAVAAATSSHHAASHGQSSGRAPEQQQQQQPQQQSSGGWPWQQEAPTFSPEHDRAALLHVVSGCLQQQLLGCVVNYPPMVQAEAISTDGGRLGDSGEAFCERVTDRLQLTPLQELHLSICMAEVQRMNATSSAQDLLQRAAEPSLLVAAAQHERQQSQEPQTPQGPPPVSPQQQQQQHEGSWSAASIRAASPVSTTAASTPAAAAAGASGGAQQQQQGHEAAGGAELSGEQEYGSWLLKQIADKRHINLISASLFIANTLTLYQMAVLAVASYPQIPMCFAVANTAARRTRQRQQQWLQDLAAGKVPDGLGPAWGQALGFPARSGECCEGAGGAAVPYSQQLLHEHERERAEELRLHQRHCWEQLGVDLPAEEPHQQQQQQGC